MAVLQVTVKLQSTEDREALEENNKKPTQLPPRFLKGCCVVFI